MKSLSQKFIIIGLMSILISFSPVSAPKTSAFWGEFVEENYHFLLKKIDDTITGTILGMLKQQAAKMLTEQISKMVGGNGSSTSSAMFITDWRDYLVKQPEQNAKNYINDYISKTLSGKGSTSNYIPNNMSKGFLSQGADSSTYAYAQEGFFGTAASAQVPSFGSNGGGGGNYFQILQDIAKKATSDKPQPTVTYEGDPSQMFAQGNLKNMELYLSGINNPWAYGDHVKEEFDKKTAEEKKIAETKSQAYEGFKGAGENKDGTGTIKTPGSLIKDNMANVQDIGNKILASATHPEEVISSVVSQLISQAIQNGIGQIQQAINKEVDGLNSKLNESLNNTNTNLGPGSSNGNQQAPSGSCLGKKEGDSCQMPNPINGKLDGKCVSGVCVPKS